MKFDSETELFTADYAVKLTFNGPLAEVRRLSDGISDVLNSATRKDSTPEDMDATLEMLLCHPNITESDDLSGTVYTYGLPIGSHTEEGLKADIASLDAVMSEFFSQVQGCKFVVSDCSDDNALVELTLVNHDFGEVEPSPKASPTQRP